MKKVKFSHLRLLIALGTATVVFNSCAIFNSSGKKDVTTDKGVIINGVTWATRNVDAPGTFAKTPESAGMFYQWNRKVGWSATEPIADIAIDNWDNTYPNGTGWKKNNDPSPKGWRVPTIEEQKSLLDADKVTNEWTTQNGVIGRKFTDKATGNQLFLPTAGARGNSDGTLYGTGVFGAYWSSTAHDSRETHAYLLDINGKNAVWSHDSRSYGVSVRAVAE